MRRYVICALILSALLAIGCDDSTGVPAFGYRDATSPQNVIQNLVDAYKRREVQPYAKLLAPEYRFVFQPYDVLELGKEDLSRDEDILGTTALFTTAEVSDIRLELTLSDTTAAADTTLPADAVRIRANLVALQVDETSGISWLVTDIQDFFLRPGRPANGESAADWYLLEWRDIPATLVPRIQPGRGITWGRLKTVYRLPTQAGS